MFITPYVELFLKSGKEKAVRRIQNDFVLFAAKKFEERVNNLKNDAPRKFPGNVARPKKARTPNKNPRPVREIPRFIKEAEIIEAEIVQE